MVVGSERSNYEAWHYCQGSQRSWTQLTPDIETCNPDGSCDSRHDLSKPPLISIAGSLGRR